MERPTWGETWMNAAHNLALRGTCLRRNYGAVIVSADNVHIADGYSGAPRGIPNCSEVGKCSRKEQNIPSGQRYEMCRSVHAENNAVINAARSGVAIPGHSRVYVYGVDAETGGMDAKTGKEVNSRPCLMCRRVIINAGIDEVIFYKDGQLKKELIFDWIMKSRRDPMSDLEP